MPLNKIDLLVLYYPDAPGNARRLPNARRKAHENLALLEECLRWVEPDDPIGISIKADIDEIKSAPGFKA